MASRVFTVAQRGSDGACAACSNINKIFAMGEHGTVRVRRISRFVVSIHLRLLHVTIKFTLMLLPCYAAVYWARVTVGGGIVYLIGRWLMMPWLRLQFAAVVSLLRGSLHSTLYHHQISTHQPLLYSRDHEFYGLIRTAEVIDSMHASSSAARPRRATIEPLKVDRILSSAGTNSPIKPSPAEHIGSPQSATTTQASEDSPRPSSSHSRSESLADVARQGKRFSVNFPLQSSSRPTSWYNSPTHSPVLSASPNEATSFLNKLAAQERRVLELKEALRQAEAELETLKKQWAKEEATKKRSEVRSVQKLQPLSTPLPALDSLEDDPDGSSEWLQKEMERRKDILSGVKTSNRKVFSGSKHLRTLSLLSPERGHFNQPFPEPLSNNDATPTQPRKIVRSSTSDMAAIMNGDKDDRWENASEASMSRDAFLKTGKQMATDIKDGLMTFFEDIRQATIGQEGITATTSRITQNTKAGRPITKTPAPRGRGTSRESTERRTSSSSTRTKPSNSTHVPDPLIDIGASFWHENGFEATTPIAKAPPKPGSRLSAPAHHAHMTPTAKPKDLDDAWDTWGTPQRSSTRRIPASPPADSSGSSPTGSSSGDARSTPVSSAASPPPPRGSAATNRTLTPTTAAAAASDAAIPWPAIHKLAPSNLRRTASHLMSEWERSLAPPGEQRAERAAGAP